MVHAEDCAVFTRAFRRDDHKMAIMVAAVGALARIITLPPYHRSDKRMSLRLRMIATDYGRWRRWPSKHNRSAPEFIREFAELRRELF